MYMYKVDGIKWPEESSHKLPDKAIVGISNSMALDGDDDEFDAAVIEALAEQFGIEPLDMGAYWPDDDDESDEDDEDDE